MKRIIWIFILAIPYLILFSCKKEKQAEPQGEILLRVGSQLLYRNDFIEYFQKTKEFQKAQKISAEDVQAAVEKYFARDLYLLADARAHDMQNDSQLKRYVLKKKMDLLTGFDGPLYKKIIPESLEPDESEMRGWYNRLKYRIWIGAILLGEKSLADSLRGEILRGAISFGDAAKKYSRDLRSARFGGFISQAIIPGTLTEDFERAAFSLNPNELSAPVRTSRGYYLIMVLKKETTPLKPFDEEKEMLTKRFIMVKKKQIAEKFINDLLMKYSPTIDPKAFPALRKAYANQTLDADKLTSDERNRIAVRFREGQPWSVADVIFFYNGLNSKDRIPIEYRGDLVLIVQKLAVPYVMYLKAVSDKLDQNDQFRSKIRRYTRERIIARYKKEMIDSKIKIDNQQVKEFYFANREKWPGQPFKNAKPYVKYYLFQEQRKKLMAGLLDSLKQKYSIQYEPDELTNTVRLLNQLKSI